MDRPLGRFLLKTPPNWCGGILGETRGAQRGRKSRTVGSNPTLSANLLKAAYSPGEFAGK
jgi:hypothetical protein